MNRHPKEKASPLPGTKKGRYTTLYPVAVTMDGIFLHGECPTLPECKATAQSFEALLFLMADSIKKRLIEITETSFIVGTPQYPDYYIETRPEYQGKEITWLMVPVDWSVIGSSSQHISVTIPGHLLARFDQYAESAGISRSGFLVQAAAQFLADRKNQ